MICRRCLLRLSARQRSNPSSPLLPRKSFTHFSRAAQAQAVSAQTTTATNARPHGHPAATSTSAAQPFSAQFTPILGAVDNASAPLGETEVARRVVKSGTPAGTILKGLNFFKNKEDPLALEDAEYPAWLWEVLDSKSGSGEDGGAGGDGEGDLFAKSKKQRRLAAKTLRKQQATNPELLEPKVPLHEQSIDLASGDGTLDGAKSAGKERHDLTRSMRKERKRKIKEDNFLKTMR